MKYIDYHFDISASGILFTDTKEELLKSEYITPGTVFVTEILDDGRIFLRIVNPDTLDYHLGDINTYDLI